MMKTTRTCDEPGCDRPHRARGYCGSHWNKHYAKKQQPKTYECTVCGTATLRLSNKRWNKVCSQMCWYFNSYGQWQTSVIPGTHEVVSCEIPEDHLAYPHSKYAWSWRVFFPDCVICNKTFATPYTTTTCSPECAKVKRARDRRLAKDKRRALERAAFVEPVMRTQIHERDQWRCHLCGKRVDPSKAVPDPLAPTIDHVIPLAKGGMHEPANVRTAHFLCNSRKGDRGGGEQLMIAG